MGSIPSSPDVDTWILELRRLGEECTSTRGVRGTPTQTGCVKSLRVSHRILVCQSRGRTLKTGKEEKGGGCPWTPQHYDPLRRRRHINATTKVLYAKREENSGGSRFIWQVIN